MNLLRNEFSVEVAQSLVEILKNHKTLKTLCGIAQDQAAAELYAQGLTDADATLISGDLQVNGALTTLGLFNNLIGDEGAKSLADSGFGKFFSWK